MIRCNLRKDDIVQVIAGKEKGKKGKIMALFPEQGRLQIEKLNIFKRHVKADQKNNQGGIVEREGKINVTNVLLVCDRCGKGVRIKRKKLEDGKRVRMCCSCGEVIDKV
tara:strand:+ start:2897 stop:3223 length:327 start_codon:yes stop_codon:yes gene_type:complete